MRVTTRKVKLNNSKTLLKIIEISRTIQVPPFTSVIVHSYGKIAEDFSVDFIATGKFYGDGYSGEEIKKFLGNGLNGKLLPTIGLYLVIM